MNVSVLTQHNDTGRTGANLYERVLNPSNVNVNTFGRLFSCAVAGQIYAQPLYVPNVLVPGQGMYNVIYICTMLNYVYAFDADAHVNGRGIELWRQNLGPAVNAQTTYPGYADILGAIGIVSTPVIDACIGNGSEDTSCGLMYVVTFTQDAAGFYQRLFALDITDGHVVDLGEGCPNPVDIVGQVPGTGDGHDNRGYVPFMPKQQMQRPALLLSQGILYIGFGSHGDRDPYHGWLFAYDAKTLKQIDTFCSTPNGNQAGIWQAGQGPAADATGHVYCATGNGTFQLQGGKFTPGDQPDTGESFLKFDTSKGLALVDGFTPFLDRENPQGDDQDLGAAAPLLIPNSDLMVGGGKDGIFYVLNRNDMGAFTLHRGQLQKFIATFDQHSKQVTHHIHGSPVFWHNQDYGPLIYVWGENETLRTYQLLENQRFPVAENPHDPELPFGVPLARGSTIATVEEAGGGMPGGMLSLSATGSEPASGIVWASFPPKKNANQNTVQGTLQAYDASQFSSTGHMIELWNSQQRAGDDFGNFAKFCYPTVANGKVYMATFSTQLCVYGLVETPAGYNLGFGGTTGLSLTGSTKVNAHSVLLTDGGQFQAGSVFSTEKVNISRFATQFRIRLTNAHADGMTFTIQNEGPHALGSHGAGLGYGTESGNGHGPFIPASVAIKFDLFSNDGEGNNSTGLYVRGEPPLEGPTNSLLSPVNLHSGHELDVEVSYDGTILRWTVKDAITGDSATRFFLVDIPDYVGDVTAHVGFTGATGGETAIQEIVSWSFMNP